MSTFFERYEDLMPVNPAVVRLAKVIILMSFAAHLGVSWEFKHVLNIRVVSSTPSNFLIVPGESARLRLQQYVTTYPTDDHG